MTTDAETPPPPDRPRHVRLPVFLLVATCLSTFWAGAADWNPTGYAELVYGNIAGHWSEGSWVALLFGWNTANATMDWWQGFRYMGVVMVILLAHEMGHFLLARRNRIPASLPYFIPLPIIPFGTLGAVIGMEGSRANRREMFDLGIAGPLAGLAVTLPVLWVGVLELKAVPDAGQYFCFHNPLVLQWLIEWIRPDYPTPDVIWLNQFNSFLMAGWVGLLVTGLNMLPVSQLDGGHVSYALLGRHAHTLARTLLIGAIVYVLATESYFWIVMLVLVILLGADHPPTADDACKLGWPRRLLGWAALLIPLLCFSPYGITPAGH